MGDVYLANDLELERRVALKILHENLSRESQAKARLLREARAVAKLDHPNICAIYEISESDDCSFIVMQFVEGETLADILVKERLSVKKSRNFAIQIADALEEAHLHHIIHRDIKPSNIIVNQKGQLKVLDFGLAKFIEAETEGETSKRLSSSGAIMGTVPYMSPEQLRGKRLDARTDIFSFGVLVYEMLSGISPFQHDSNAESISAILKDEPDWTRIPIELRPIAQKSLMKDKDERYQTAKDFAQDLRNIGATSPTADGKFWNRIFSHKTAKQKGSVPRYYFWKSSESGDGVTPKTKQITNRQNTKPAKMNLNNSAVFSVSFALFILIGDMVWLVWQFSTKSDSHSFDSLRSVRLVSWKTGASSP
jgi:serine/threonine protein kinase